MNWTKTLPKKPGDYRRRWPLASNYALFNLPEGGKVPPAFTGCEWCGPLVPVEEVGKAYREGFQDGEGDNVCNEDFGFATSRARKIVEGEI